MIYRNRIENIRSLKISKIKLYASDNRRSDSHLFLFFFKSEKIHSYFFEIFTWGKIDRNLKNNHLLQLLLKVNSKKALLHSTLV